MNAKNPHALKCAQALINIATGKQAQINGELEPRDIIFTNRLYETIEAISGSHGIVERYTKELSDSLILEELSSLKHVSQVASFSLLTRTILSLCTDRNNEVGEKLTVARATLDAIYDYEIVGCDFRKSENASEAVELTVPFPTLKELCYSRLVDQGIRSPTNIPANLKEEFAMAEVVYSLKEDVNRKKGYLSIISRLFLWCISELCTLRDGIMEESDGYYVNMLLMTVVNNNNCAGPMFFMNRTYYETRQFIGINPMSQRTDVGLLDFKEFVVICYLVLRLRMDTLKRKRRLNYYDKIRKDYDLFKDEKSRMNHMEFIVPFFEQSDHKFVDRHGASPAEVKAAARKIDFNRRLS